MVSGSLASALPAARPAQSGTSSRGPARYADLCALPETVIGEILDGELVASPRPTCRHAGVLTSLIGTLWRPYQRGIGGPGGWWLLVEPEVHLDQQVLVPDVAGWRRETLATHPTGAAVDTVPDWVCEVVSPATVRYDRVTKRALYARYGAAFFWLIDPVARTLEVLRRDDRQDDGWAVAGSWSGDAEITAPPFVACPIPLGALWVA